METQTTPFTMRLPEETLNTLKVYARSKAVEVNADITYVDLIREAVDKIYGTASRSPDDWPIKTSEEFWTDEKIEEFPRTPTGQILATAIENSNFQEVCTLSKKILTDEIQQSLGCKILRPTKGENNRCVLERPIASTASVISRRGAIPEQKTEGDFIEVPRFDICAAPYIRQNNLRPHVLYDMIVKASQAIRKELDSNVLNLIRAAANARGDQILTTTCDWSSSEFMQALKWIARHELVPSNFVMHPDSYIAIRTFGSDFLVAPPLKIALETRNYGHIMGVPVALSCRCDNNSIFLLGPAAAVGALYQPSPPLVKHATEISKLRENFVFSIEVGLAVVNEYAIVKMANRKD